MAALCILSSSFGGAKPIAYWMKRFVELYDAELIGSSSLGPVEAAMVRFRRKLDREPVRTDSFPVQAARFSRLANDG